MNELHLRRESDYLKLTYKYDLQEDEVDDMLVLPCQNIVFLINIYINGNLLNLDSYNGSVEQLGDQLSKNEIWRFYNLETKLFLESHNSMKLILQQDIHHDIESTRVNRLQRIQYNIDLMTNSPIIKMETLIKHLNYSMSILIINLEYKFPLIFSIYGCQYFAIQVNWLKWYIKEVFDSQTITASELNRIFVENLFNIQKLVLYEYNTINIFKEIDRSNIKRKLFITDVKKVNECTKIKSLLFNYNLFQ